MTSVTAEESGKTFHCSESDSNKEKSPAKYRTVKINSEGANRDDNLSPADLREILERLTHEETESKDIKQSVVRKLTADMTERGRKIGAHLESIHGYAVKDCTHIEDSQDQCLSEELADELRKRTTSVDSEIKQLENQMGQLQRTLVKGKARRESIRHRMSASSPSGGRKVSAMSSCSSTSEVDEFTSEDYKAKIELLENEKLEWLEDKKDLGDEIKFLKYQLQYRIDVQSLQNDNTDKRESDKLVKENETLREENCNLKERLSTIKERLEEKGNVEENLLSIADVCNESAVSCESDIERLHTERKILLSTIMRMQSLEKDEDEPVTFADFGVQVDLNKLETIEENVATTPLVAKLTKENKALKKHITDMQKDLDEYEYDRKALNEENFKLIDEKRSLEDTSNKLRTQMSDTLDTTLDEIEQLHDFNEDLEGKFKRTEANFNQVLQTLNDLQSKNCKALESMLDEVESKVTMEETFEYLDNEVSKLIQQNLSTTFQSAGPQVMQASKEEKQFSSNLLSEVKSCKEMLESQRSHIRKLQLDKRDIEEGYTNMKRELLLLKSSKQRARENSKELQFLRKRRAKSLNDGAAGATEAKAVLVDKESLQREVKRLGSVKVELENTIQKLKKEKTTLDDEKVCLLSSLYHQLERNESLEMQVEELSLALQQWEAKSDLDNDVFGEKTNEVKDSKPTAEEASDQSLKSPDAVATEIVPEGLEAGGDEAKEIQELSPNELDVEMSGRPTSLVVSVVSSAAQESMQEMKQKIHALGEQLQKVQESVYELETERDKILEDLEDSKKNEKELRNVIVQLKRENSIHKDKLAKSNELVETLQIRLRDAQDAKEEAIESLEEAKEEKTVSRKHCEVLNNRLNEVTIQRDNFKKKTEHYNQYLQEIFNRTAEISNISLTRDEHDTAKEQSSTGTQKDCELSQDDLETRLLDGLGAIQISIDDIKSKLSESCMKMSTLKRQLDVSNTEKDALQKSLRETDEKKKQLKGFITKLTEEKEKVNEQLDEMKQQKCNLADALENVYQSKEKLQNRLTETLCKQEQYKKSLVEAIDEAKTLKESLYRMVNEHETMKESLLIANREVERLKSQQILHNGTSAMNVIEEEDEQLSSEEENEQNKESDPNEKDVATIHVAETEMGPRIDRKNLCEVLDQLKESLNSLSRENALFESQVKQLLCASETKDVAPKTEERIEGEIPPERVNGKPDLLDENGVHSEDDRSEAKGIEEEIFICVSEKLSKDEEIFSVIQVEIAELEELVEDVTLKMQTTGKEREDNEAISGLMQLQQDLLIKKFDSESKEAEDNKQLVEWFEVISTEKENLERELEDASKENIELLTNLATLREEKHILKSLLDSVQSSTQKDPKESKESKEPKESKEKVEMDEMDEKGAEPIQRGNDEQLMPIELQRELQELKEFQNDGKKEEQVLDHFDTLEELDMIQLKHLVEKLQKENTSLNTKFSELLEKSNHFNMIERELESSIHETQILEKQVMALSKEGATLRREADERVLRLIELEESMILTIEKKLELAEYASFLNSKKDTLEKKCEELSREIKGLTESRDQILALKLKSDEQMGCELKELKQHKEKAVREIEDLSDILRIGRQDFEAIKIELDSLQRKNRALKQELEKACAREKQMTSDFEEKLSGALALKSGGLEELNASGELELLKLKSLKLENDVKSVSERAKKLEKERDVFTSLLTQLTSVYDTEVNKTAESDYETGEKSLEIKFKVAELKNWIRNTSEVMTSYAHKTKMLSSFVQEVDEKTSQILEGEEVDAPEPSSKSHETNELAVTNAHDEASKESFENARCKFELLIKKFKESFQNETSFQTQLGQIKQDNERITKELTIKSNFLQTMRDSFEQLLQERNLLAEKAAASGVQPEEKEQKDIKPEKLPDELQKASVCSNCRELERERDELKSEISSMNDDSVELNNKCRLLKEHLVLLKQQQESMINNNIPTDLGERVLDLPNAIQETVSPDILVACQSAPVFESEVDINEETPDIDSVTSSEKELFQDEQLYPEINEATELECSEAVDEVQEINSDTKHDIRSQLRKLQEEMESLKDSNKYLENEITTWKEKIKEIKHEHHRETTELRKEFHHQEQELYVLYIEKEERKALIADLKSKIADLKSMSQVKKPSRKETSTSDTEEESDKLHKMLAERSSSLKDLNEKLGVSKNFMQKILDENRDLKEDVANFELEQKECKKEIEVLKAEIDLKKTALREAKDEKSQLESKKLRLEEDLASVKEQLKSRGTLLATLEKDKGTFKANLRKTQQEASSLEKQYDLLQELSESGKQRQKDTENLVKKLKQSCDEMTANFEKVSTEKKTLEDALTEELQIERNKNENYKEQIANLEKNQLVITYSLGEYKDKVQNLTRELRRDKSRRDREMGSIKEENAKLLGDEERVQKVLENLREQLDDERNKNDKLEDDLKTAIIDNLTLNNSLKVQSDEKNKKSQELEGNKKESKRLCTITGDLKAKISHLEALLKATKDEKKFLADEIDKIKAVCTDLRLRLSEASEDKEELEDILGEMREKRQRLHDEIDKALTERDELEDQAIDIKKEITKKLQLALEENKKTETALEQFVKEEATLREQLDELEKSKLEYVEKNTKLKDDLEKTKTELIQLLGKSDPPKETEGRTCNDKHDAKQLLDAQCEVQRLNSLLEKSQKEIENLKTKLESKTREETQQQELQKVEEQTVTVVQSEVQSCVNIDESEDRDGALEDYTIENMRLRAQLQEADRKVINLQDELYNVSKKEVHDEFKLEATKRECKTLIDDLRKSRENMVKLKTNLQASDAIQTDLRKNLRTAVADKEKYESKCKRLVLAKGVVEKVKVTSMEIPAVSQVEGHDRDVPIAKAESLESARKEIVILEAQVKDLRSRSKTDREFVEEMLSKIAKELTRALKKLGVTTGQEDKTDTLKANSFQSLNYDDLQDKLCDLRKMIDSLNPRVQEEVDAVPKDENRLSRKLDFVISENNRLNDKLQFLQDKLSDILEEKQVLEDIGSSTRKELSAIVKCLSSEREEMVSISSDRLQMKAKLITAEKNEQEFRRNMNSLEQQYAELHERNRRLEMAPEIKIEKQELQNAVESTPLQHEDDLLAESKHLEMEIMEQDRELQWLRKDCKELTAVRDELKIWNKKLQEERNEFEAANKKLGSQNQDLYAETKRKERHLMSYREDNDKLLTIQKTSETQIRHLNREIELFSDRVVCCEMEKEQLEEINRQQLNEIQESFLQKSKDNAVREKLENLFYENTKVKEQKKMLAARLQSLERDMKSQILTTRDLEAEKEELFGKIDKTENEKHNEISKKERLAYLLDKHEKDSRRQIDALSRLVEKLTRDKDELCAKNPRLDKIHLEIKKLGKECSYKDGVIGKLQEQNQALRKDNDALHRSYDKFKLESQRIATSTPEQDSNAPPFERSNSLRISPRISEQELKAPYFERSGSLRLSPRLSHKSGSKTSSFSSFDRVSLASSHVSDQSSDRNMRRDASTRIPTIRRSSSRRRDEHDGDSSSAGSQECFCSPILSVVNLCSDEVQQPEQLGPSARCPVCKKRKSRKGTIKEHYV